MCDAPNRLADGTETACRECKPCKRLARNTWVGRNMAESKTAKFCYVITATYGRGRAGEILHERAVILTYSDCQKLFKLLRRHGCKVRFFITGEYGSERQRAHWNIIIYTDKPLPAFSGWDQYGKWLNKARYKQRFNWVRVDKKGEPVMLQNGQPAYWWPHGFVHVDEVSLGSVNYVCKYVTKDFDANGKQGHKGQSKAPPLGTQYFDDLAMRYVEQGLAPQTPEYRFPEARTRKGEPISFWLKGAVLIRFLEAYVIFWACVRPNQKRPPSKLVDLFEKYGVVVNGDEYEWLARQEFPSGESRTTWAQRFPGGADQIRREAEVVRYERAVLAREAGAEQRRAIDDAWLLGITDEQERQRQQERIAAERARDWYAFNHHWGRHFYPQHGWQLQRTDSTEPCQCCDPAAYAAGGQAQQLLGQQYPPDDQRDDGRGSRAEPNADYGLGPVGRYNRDYKQPRSAGPGNKS